MCLVALLGLVVPRFALFLLWVFSDRLNQAFPSFVVGALGFVLLPFTTLFYAVAFTMGSGVSGFGWILVGFGAVLDLSNHANGGRESRRRARRRADRR